MRYWIFVAFPCLTMLDCCVVLCILPVLLYLFHCIWMSDRCELRRRISNQLDMLQDSQRASSLVHSGQQMSVLQRQFGRLWWLRPRNISQFSAVGQCVDWISEVMVDMARFRSVLKLNDDKFNVAVYNLTYTWGNLASPIVWDGYCRLASILGSCTLEQCCPYLDVDIDGWFFGQVNNGETVKYID